MSKENKNLTLREGFIVRKYLAGFNPSEIILLLKREGFRSEKKRYLKLVEGIVGTPIPKDVPDDREEVYARGYFDCKARIINQMKKTATNSIASLKPAKGEKKTKKEDAPLRCL